MAQTSTHGISKSSRSFLEKSAHGPAQVQETDRPITGDDIWLSHGPKIWRAPGVADCPDFYPAYSYGDLYSYSPLALLLSKGTFDLDAVVARRARSIDSRYLSSSRTLVTDIRRVGGPLKPQFFVRNERDYVQKLCKAILENARTVEERNIGFTNVIMCGGKVSLNLFLFPWKNPVITASGQPDLGLVKRYIDDNRLRIDGIELRDDDESLLDAEVLLNFCRNNLQLCRWSRQLKT